MGSLGDDADFRKLFGCSKAAHAKTWASTKMFRENGKWKGRCEVPNFNSGNEDEKNTKQAFI